MTTTFLYIISMIMVFLWIASNFLKVARHERRLLRVPIRIHVNGIRGKSTVSRIIAGLLREARIQTVAKTTGSAACFILPDGQDERIHRNGAATILEQVDFVRKKVSCTTQAVVVECMAIRPEYQKICESKIIQSNIGIITNVREDHQDVMGETLEEIAKSLMNTCPKNGVLITSESNRDVLKTIRTLAERNNCRLIPVSENSVTDEELRVFPYIAFKENIAIGFAVAELLKIPRQKALSGMVAAKPDPGALRVRHLQIRSKQQPEKKVTWANLFAINDRQSVIKVAESLLVGAGTNCTRIAILNNRSDREDRALQFAEIVARDLNFDMVALIGAYEPMISEILREKGVGSKRQILMGEHRGFSPAEMLHKLIHATRCESIFLAGMVNIHSDQATQLLSFFEPEFKH